MTNVVSWLAAIFSLTFAYPWARMVSRRVSSPRRDPALTLSLTVALSLGALAALMLWLAAWLRAPLRFGWVTALALGVDAVGWGVWWRVRGVRTSADGARRRALGSARRAAEPRVGRAEHGQAARPPTHAPVAAPKWATALALGLTALTGALILFNAAYWPFRDSDTLAIYGPVSLNFVRTGEFYGGGMYDYMYDSYPVLVPLTFSYLHMAAGAPNPFAARFVIAALSLVTVGVAYALGRELFGRAVGVTAAFLTVTTPVLTHWAAAGYTDLPAGAYYALTALMAWKLYTSPRPLYALLTGVMAGLAALSKNGALLLVGSLAGWVFYSHWAARWPDAEGRPIRARYVALMLAGYAPTAGLWYAHVWLEYGWLVAPTGWIDQAQRTLRAALEPTLGWRSYMAAGVFAVPAVIALLGWLWRTRWRFAARPALLLGFALPFWGVWWGFFSYDPRFLMMIWALLAVMSAWLLVALFRRLPQWAQRVTWRVLPPVLIVLALPAMRTAVEYKYELLRDPWMSEAKRYRVYVSPGYDAVLWLREHVPPDARVMTTDGRLAYYISITHPHVATRAPSDANLCYDYWLVHAGVSVEPWEARGAIQPLFTRAGYTVYRVLHADP